MQLRDVMMRVGTVMLCLFFIVPRAGAECSESDAAKAAVPSLIAQGAEVYDKKSNLTWQRCSIGQRWEASSGCLGTPRKFTFDEAQAQANGAWRVPTIDELSSIVADHCKEPAIDPLFFPNTPPEQFWTSNIYSPMVFYVSFRNGSPNPTYYSDSRYAVRLVRSGE